ncbi:MAG: hypothetical protein CVV27_04805 [Candidatus Melainabacteria bacterium HGW-Melainabacteria-1]|nr:MAG: hypothetical protein CVV27_04805 [Candidatus Melainabacteria bacterium HGW-Melainabacteria-1]
MAFDPYGKEKNIPRKKYLYQFSFGEESFTDDFVNEFEAEFEQPKGRRQAKKQTHAKRKRVSDYY